MKQSNEDRDSWLAMDDYPRFPPEMIARHVRNVIQSPLVGPNSRITISEKDYREVMRRCIYETAATRGPAALLSDKFLSRLEKRSHEASTFSVRLKRAMSIAPVKEEQ